MELEANAAAGSPSRRTIHGDGGGVGGVAALGQNQPADELDAVAFERGLDHIEGDAVAVDTVERDVTFRAVGKGHRLAIRFVSPAQSAAPASIGGLVQLSAGPVEAAPP